MTLEEIDRDWLTAALRTRAPDVTVRDFSIVNVINGTCTKVRLRLAMDEAGQRAGIPETVILKGGFEPHSRIMAMTHEKEVRSYRQVLGALHLRSPRWYFAEYDAEQKQGIVIMEDLVARGVQFCHPLTPQTPEQTAARLTALAHFHAQTWNSPELAAGGRWGWPADLLPAMRSYMTRYLKPGAWQPFIDAPRGAAVAKQFQDLQWMDRAIDAMARLAQQLPSCIIHGDTHLGNLYFDVDGAPGFFDPQIHRAPSLVEFAYHVGGGLDPADRRRSESALLKHYLDELQRCGIQPPAFADAWRAYGAFLAFGYGVFITNESMFQPEAINTAYTSRFSVAMLDHDTTALLAAVT
jgi:hypothetical protein